MTLEIAIIADDLTGALDSAAPFAARGLRTMAALDPTAVEEIPLHDVSVLAINTLTRHEAPQTAARIAAEAARRSRAAGARVILKKIDSRMRGQVGPEALAIARALGAQALVVAPAVPSQGRVVEVGAVRGAGIDDAAGIDVKASFATIEGLVLEVPDTRTEHDLDEVAASCLARAETVLAVGAHGLAAAFARQLRPAVTQAQTFVPAHPMLLVVGSQDPATAAQVAAIAGLSGAVTVIEAPGGRLAAPPAEPPAAVTVLRSIPDANASADPAERFAEAAAAWMRGLRPRTILATGGDTAAALFEHQGYRVLEVGGEVAAGMPWSHAPDGTVIVTKSGGFGRNVELLELARLSNAATIE